MAIDPYSSPASGVQPPVYTSNATVTQGVLQQLAGTKPWVRFLSVMMFIGAGLMLILAAVFAVMGGTIASASKNPVFGGAFGFVFAGVYAVLGVFYIFPAIKLWKYATYIASLLISGDSVDLEKALNQQRSLWKFVGIFVLVIISLYALFFIGAIVMAFFGAMSARH